MRVCLRAVHEDDALRHAQRHVPRRERARDAEC